MMSFLSLIVGFCLIILFSGWGHLNLFVTFTILLFSIAFIFDIARSRKYRLYVLPLAMGYFLRVFLLFYDVYTRNPLHLPLVGSSFITSDPYWFFRSAVQYSQGYEINYGGYFSKLIGLIFSVTGPSRLLGEFVVLLFSLGTILVFINIVNELDIKQTFRKNGVYLICLFPNYALLSVVFRRETIITFFVGLSILYFVRWFRNKTGEKGFVFSIIFALIASMFHGATGLLVVNYIFIRMLYSPESKTFALRSKNFIGALFFVFIITFVYARWGSTFFNKIEQRMESGVYSSVRDAGGSSYAQYVGDARTPANVVIYAIPRYLFYMFSPFPWQWRGMGDVIAFLLSSCVYLMIIIDTLRYIRHTDKKDENRKILIALFIVTLLIAEIFSWGVTNTGTATRHRDKFIVLYSVMFVLSGKTRLRLKLGK